MADLSLLRSIGEAAQFRKGEVIFIEGDAGENMYIVLKGKFGVYINSFADFPVCIADIGPGAFFGEMSLIDGWNRSATIITEEDGMVIAVGKDKFALLLGKSPDIAGRLLETLRERADATAETVRGMGKNVPLAAYMYEGSSGGNVKAQIDLMTDMAKHIRQINKLLYESPAEKAEIPEIAEAPKTPAAKPKGGALALLPEGYTKLNIEDKNDNSAALQKKNASCPYCFEDSEIYVPQQLGLVPLRHELGGRVVYRDFNILLYTNIVCPNCNYTDTYHEFCKFKKNIRHVYYTGNQFMNAENFTGFANTHNHSFDEAVLSYYLNLKCMDRYVAGDPLRYAKVWIRLHWIYSDAGEEVLSKQSAEKAIDLYNEYLEINAGKIFPQDVMRINAILGELCAGINDYRQALGYYEANILLGKNTPAARKLMDESRERRREINNMLK